MKEDPNPGLKIFLEFTVLIALLAGFNLYTYFRGGSRMFLVVGIIAVVVFIGWIIFYFLYVRKPAQRED
jgi:hypothetical protein